MINHCLLTHLDYSPVLGETAGFTGVFATCTGVAFALSVELELLELLELPELLLLLLSLLLLSLLLLLLLLSTLSC